MKLRNKKTGEVVEVNNFNGFVHLDDDTKIYSSLAELNEEWGVCEESEGYWYVDSDGEVYPTTAGLNRFDLDRMANIGNLFETKEEAEKAVERLRAWKRLKDKGFRFKGLDRFGNIRFEADDKYKSAHLNLYPFREFEKDESEFLDDLYSLFGGEE